MKRFIQIFCIPFFLLTQGVYADLESGIFGSVEMTQPEKKGRHPFDLSFSYDKVTSSKFSKKRFKHDSQSYSETEAEVGAVFYYNPCYEEGAKVTLGYLYTDFQWKHNPFFRRNHFNYASVALGFATKRVTNWLWQASVAMNQDTDHLNVGKYANYDILLWGRYNWSRCVGYHVGFLAFTGMNINKVWPVIGFDYEFSRKWKLNGVYPMNISLVYRLNQNFSAALAGRAFYNRYRVGAHERVREAIFEYLNSGAEFALNYECSSRIKLNAHAGRTFGGEIRISNKYHHHVRHLDIDSAFYFGGSLDFSF